MKYRKLALTAIFGLASCRMPGRPAPEARAIRPSEVTDFGVLYAQNCSGCHGVKGEGGLTVGIGSPIYLAIADDATIRRVVEAGRPGTAMPAFAREAGGFLTAAQIEILVHGIRTHWGRVGVFGKDRPPAYASSEPGDPARGHSVFKANCAACHGPDGRGARTIADNSFLALVSDQHLRTVVITGMPHLGMPDWRTHAQPLSDTDVTDLVGWLVTQRTPLSSQLKRAGGSE
ncbi:c-type cytochrome [Paludibaculum fermentans]|uniref:c-type cytochrome n=1 Tax=Paludibaculum fermentans TaxID=1473598 RepID=UPI003EBBB71C